MRTRCRLDHGIADHEVDRNTETRMLYRLHQKSQVRIQQQGASISFASPSRGRARRWRLATHSRQAKLDRGIGGVVLGVGVGGEISGVVS